MPLGYWWTVALTSWGVPCALTRWRRLGSLSAIPALLVSELPFFAGYLLIASTVLALAEGDLDSAGGTAAAAVALLALAGLVVVVRRALRAHAALGNTGKPGRPWGRILRAPFFPGRLDVVRVRNLAYGDGPRRTLDVYHRRDRPTGSPILLHIHGGGFRSGNKAREARPLIRHLTSHRGFVCVSANYRLQPHVTIGDQVADVRAAIAWTRAHAGEYGAGPGPLFLAGSSAGANLAIRAVSQGETGIAGLICATATTAISRRPATCHPCSWYTARTTRGYRHRACAPLLNGYARCRATRSSTPNYPARTTTSTSTSRSGRLRSAWPWTSSPASHSSGHPPGKPDNPDWLRDLAHPAGRCGLWPQQPPPAALGVPGGEARDSNRPSWSV